MYTDDTKENLYDDEELENEKWDNHRGLIFKIIIIILCIGLLIWLISVLKNRNNTSDNSDIHLANTEKIRLAGESYFFLRNNKDKVQYINVAGLKREGLLSDIVDANNKVCSDSGTLVNLDNNTDSYVMTIKFSCSTNDKNEVFYYNKNTLACLNCNGKTHMDGKTVVIDDDKEKENDSSNDNQKDEENPTYSCVDWSEWTKVRVNEPELTERTKVMVTGVKYGKKTVYGEWSEYTKTPIVNNDGIEIETKIVNEQVWSDPKTGTSVDTSNPNIKIISTDTINDGGSNCNNGYVDNNTCYSNELIVGNLTYKEYNSGNYKVKKAYCDGVKTLKDSDGLFVITYLNCQYNKKISNSSSGRSYTIYTYQELETKDITYYRYRTISETNEPNEYTNVKYEEDKIPEGYVKLEGSEEIYYSYKLSTCEK